MRASNKVLGRRSLPRPHDGGSGPEDADEYLWEMVTYTSDFSGSPATATAKILDQDGAAISGPDTGNIFEVTVYDGAGIHGTESVDTLNGWVLWSHGRWNFTGSTACP